MDTVARPTAPPAAAVPPPAPAGPASPPRRPAGRPGPRPPAPGASPVAPGTRGGAGAGRRGLVGRGLALAATAGAVAYVALSDPGAGRGPWPPCPSRAVLGLDCPACGGLRGTHDLLRGDVVGALDHNLLLPALLAVYAYAAVVAFAPLVGRTVPWLRPPRWAVAGAVVVLVTFSVLRNLPAPPLQFLGSSES